MQHQLSIPSRAFVGFLNLRWQAGAYAHRSHPFVYIYNHFIVVVVVVVVVVCNENKRCDAGCRSHPGPLSVSIDHRHARIHNYGLIATRLLRIHLADCHLLL